MSQSHVMFRVGGQPFAIASASVHAIHDELTLQPVGGTQNWFLGLAVADGVLLPVTDLGRYLKLAPATGRTLRINPELGVGALRVDEIIGVDKTVSANRDSELPKALQTNADLFTHSLSANTGEHWVLDVPRLLQSARFTDIGVPA